VSGLVARLERLKVGLADGASGRHLLVDRQVAMASLMQVSGTERGRLAGAFEREEPGAGDGGDRRRGVREAARRIEAGVAKNSGLPVFAV
jgi:hypothetical protein